jgi:hypothetical protein
MYRCSMAHIHIKGNMFRAVFWKQSNCLRLRRRGGFTFIFTQSRKKELAHVASCVSP